MAALFLFCFFDLGCSGGDFAEFIGYFAELGGDFADVLVYFAELDWNLANSPIYFAKPDLEPFKFCSRSLSRWDFADFLFFYTELGWDFANLLVYFAKLDWNLANSLTYFAKRNHNFAETPIYSANHHFQAQKRAAIRRSFPKLLCRC